MLGDGEPGHSDPAKWDTNHSGDRDADGSHHCPSLWDPVLTAPRKVPVFLRGLSAVSRRPLAVSWAPPYLNDPEGWLPAAGSSSGGPARVPFSRGGGFFLLVRMGFSAEDT